MNLAKVDVKNDDPITFSDVLAFCWRWKVLLVCGFVIGIGLGVFSARNRPVFFTSSISLPLQFSPIQKEPPTRRSFNEKITEALSNPTVAISLSESIFKAAETAGGKESPLRRELTKQSEFVRTAGNKSAAELSEVAAIASSLPKIWTPYLLTGEATNDPVIFVLEAMDGKTAKLTMRTVETGLLDSSLLPIATAWNEFVVKFNESTRMARLLTLRSEMDKTRMLFQDSTSKAATEPVGERDELLKLHREQAGIDEAIESLAAKSKVKSELSAQTTTAVAIASLFNQFNSETPGSALELQAQLQTAKMAMLSQTRDPAEQEKARQILDKMHSLETTRTRIEGQIGQRWVEAKVLRASYEKAISEYRIFADDRDFELPTLDLDSNVIQVSKIDAVRDLSQFSYKKWLAIYAILGLAAATLIGCIVEGGRLAVREWRTFRASDSRVSPL